MGFNSGFKGLNALKYVIFQYVFNFGVKLPEDDINVAKTCSSNIKIYFYVQNVHS